MPNTKQGGGQSLTFSKKNRDIKEHLDLLKKNNVTITDYICEAIRFFEKNKDNDFKESQINSKYVEDIVERKVSQILSGHNKDIELSIGTQEHFEDNLDSIKDVDLEED